MVTLGTKRLDSPSDRVVQGLSAYFSLGHFNEWNGRSLSLFPFPTINADENEKGHARLHVDFSVE